MILSRGVTWSNLCCRTIALAIIQTRVLWGPPKSHGKPFEGVSFEIQLQITEATLVILRKGFNTVNEVLAKYLEVLPP